MPSFDVISEMNMHEVTNGFNQANKEVSNRFDFKGTDARFEMKENVITLFGTGDFQLNQMMAILRSKFSKRDIDLKAMKEDKPEQAGREARQKVTMQQGIDKELGKKIVKMIKDKKMKVQASIMDEKVRVTGKKRDDLQQIMELLKIAELEMPLQFDNFRD